MEDEEGRQHRYNMSAFRDADHILLNILNNLIDEKETSATEGDENEGVKCSGSDHKNNHYRGDSLFDTELTAAERAVLEGSLVSSRRSSKEMDAVKE